MHRLPPQTRELRGVNSGCTKFDPTMTSDRDKCTTLIYEKGPEFSSLLRSRGGAIGRQSQGNPGRKQVSYIHYLGLTISRLSKLLIANSFLLN